MLDRLDLDALLLLSRSASPSRHLLPSAASPSAPRTTSPRPAPPIFPLSHPPPSPGLPEGLSMASVASPQVAFAGAGAAHGNGHGKGQPMVICLLPCSPFCPVPPAFHPLPRAVPPRRLIPSRHPSALPQPRPLPSHALITIQCALDRPAPASIQRLVLASTNSLVLGREEVYADPAPPFPWRWSRVREQEWEQGWSICVDRNR